MWLPLQILSLLAPGLLIFLVLNESMHRRSYGILCIHKNKMNHLKSVLTDFPNNILRVFIMHVGYCSSLPLKHLQKKELPTQMLSAMTCDRQPKSAFDICKTRTRTEMKFHIPYV